MRQQAYHERENMTRDEQESRLKIVLVGEESAGYQTLQTLEKSGHEVVAVMTSRPAEGSRGGSLWRLAEKAGHRLWDAELVREARFAEQISDHSVGVLLNVHSLYIVHPEVLEAPRIGCYNLHPGPLPEYAGLNTVSWALFRGATVYGVTLHEMTPVIDAGRIVSRKLFEVEEEDNALALYWKCLKAGTPMVAKLIDDLARDPARLEVMDQDTSRREYFRAGPPDRCRLSWDQTVRRVLDFVRACDYHPYPSPWGHPRTRSKDREIAIVKASRTGKACAEPPGAVREAAESSIEVACADEWLGVQSVQVDSEVIEARSVLEPGSILLPVGDPSSAG